MKAIVTKLSICPCGFPSLQSSVGIGTEYQALQELGGFRYICGGCGKEQIITGLLVKRDGIACLGYLPKALFEIYDPEVQTLSA